MSVIWMFCRIKDYLKIKKNDYEALETSYNSNESYGKLLRRSNEVSIK